MGSSRLWHCLLIPWSLSCASAQSDHGIDRQVENRLTISSGVYGQTTSVDDVGPSEAEYFRMSLHVSAQGDWTSRATITSNEVGFYQAPLPAGAYSICTSFDRCTDFEVAEGQMRAARLRVQRRAGLGDRQSDSLSALTTGPAKLALAVLRDVAQQRVAGLARGWLCATNSDATTDESDKRDGTLVARRDDAEVAPTFTNDVVARVTADLIGAATVVARARLKRR